MRNKIYFLYLALTYQKQFRVNIVKQIKINIKLHNYYAMYCYFKIIKLCIFINVIYENIFKENV